MTQTNLKRGSGGATPAGGHTGGYPMGAPVKALFYFRFNFTL